MDLLDAFLNTDPFQDSVSKLGTIVSMQKLRVLPTLGKDLVEELADDSTHTLCVLVAQALSPGFLAVMAYCCEDIVVSSVIALQVLIDLDQVALDSVKWTLLIHYD